MMIGKAANKEHARRVKTAEYELLIFEKNHLRAIQHALKPLANAEREHSDKLTQAESGLVAMRDGPGQLIGQGFGVTAYEYWVTTPYGSGPLTGVRARVEASGQISYSGGIEHSGNVEITQRVTLTRVALMGPFALAAPKKKKHDYRQTYDTRQVHDTRQVMLLIESPHFSSAVSCGANSEAAAWDLATRINNASLRAPALLLQRPTQVKEWEEYVVAVRADTFTIEAAQSEVARVEADMQFVGPVDSAREKLAALVASPPT